MNDCNKLSYDELVQINDELRQIISNLKKEKEEHSKWTSTVYDPNRMMDQKTLIEQKVKYAVSEKNREIKTLEERLANFKEDTKKEIDQLWNDTIVPLQNQVKDKNIQLDTAYNIDRSNKERIKDLEKVIDNLNMNIQFAAGYISSTPQFKNQHPMNVLKWLRGISVQ
jgi:DNA repair exonuclease SbcCD ATPase subunit